MELSLFSFMDLTEFWTIKHQIDDEIARLGWSKLYCKQFIICMYGCRSRLDMTDQQLQDLLQQLKGFKA